MASLKVMVFELWFGIEWLSEWQRWDLFRGRISPAGPFLHFWIFWYLEVISTKENYDMIIWCVSERHLKIKWRICCVCNRSSVCVYFFLYIISMLRFLLWIWPIRIIIHGDSKIIFKFFLDEWFLLRDCISILHILFQISYHFMCKICGTATNCSKN